MNYKKCFCEILLNHKTDIYRWLVTGHVPWNRNTTLRSNNNLSFSKKRRKKKWKRKKKNCRHFPTTYVLNHKLWQCFAPVKPSGNIPKSDLRGEAIGRSCWKVHPDLSSSLSSFYLLTPFLSFHSTHVFVTPFQSDPSINFLHLFFKCTYTYYTIRTLSELFISLRCISEGVRWWLDIGGFTFPQLSEIKDFFHAQNIVNMQIINMQNIGH